MIEKIKNMIKRAATTAIMKDSGSVPTIQVKYFNKTALVEVLAPYGFCSSPPKNSMATVFNLLGQEENRTAIIDKPWQRFKNLKEGEVVIGNYLTLAKLYFKENGDVLLDLPEGNLTVNVAEGDITVNAPNGQVTIDSPRVIMTGDLEVEGTITAEGNITDLIGSNSLSMNEMRNTYDSHVHPENDSGGPTDVPNQQMN
jgi:phage gp45-like